MIIYSLPMAWVRRFSNLKNQENSYWKAERFDPAMWSVILWNISSFLVTLNSSISLSIYGLTCKQFQMQVKKCLTCWLITLWLVTSTAKCFFIILTSSPSALTHQCGLSFFGTFPVFWWLSICPSALPSIVWHVNSFECRSKNVWQVDSLLFNF
jgi:hypothetical protein